jgi:hypothetical protein
VVWLAAILSALLVAGTALLIVGSRSSQSPSPTSWTPSPTLVSQTIAPGISLITHDDAGHDLRPFLDGDVAPQGMHDVAFALDGGIWAVGPAGLFRLGHEGTYPLPGDVSGATDLTAAPDGTLWATFESGVASFRDGAWTMAPPFPGRAATVQAIEVGADGRVWASSGSAVASLDDGTWIEAHAADDSPIVGGFKPGELALSREGSLWVREGSRRLSRFDGTGWESVTPPHDLLVGLMAAGPDGEVWVYEPLVPPPSCGHGHYDQHDRLARFDQDGWTVSPHAAPRIQHEMCYYGYMAVGGDGRLWATNGDRVAVYDGTRWVETYGPPEWERTPESNGGVQTPLEVAPDGSVWLQHGSGFLVFEPTVGR